MEFNEAFARAVRKIMKPFIEGNMTVTATVISVDKTKDTCVVQETGDDNELTDVRLISVIDTISKKVVIYPKVGSIVLVGFIGKSKRAMSFVVQYSETDGLMLNGNDYSMVKAEELKTQLDKNNDLMTAIITVINSSVPITEPGSGSPSAFQAALKTAITLKTLGDFSNIKNDKVKHG